VTAVIRIQYMLRRRGMGVMSWRKRCFFLRMMLGMRMKVIQGMVPVLLLVPVLVKT
jgi:hypothetical protein